MFKVVKKTKMKDAMKCAEQTQTIHDKTFASLMEASHLNAREPNPFRARLDEIIEAMALDVKFINKHLGQQAALEQENDYRDIIGRVAASKPTTEDIEIILEIMNDVECDLYKSLIKPTLGE